MILHDLGNSRNAIGLMNIADLQKVTCRGPEIHHLKNLEALWDKCLANCKNIPDEETLQPLYEKMSKEKCGIRVDIRDR